MDNLEKMDKYLEKCNFSWPNQKQIQNMNRPLTRAETETD